MLRSTGSLALAVLLCGASAQAQYRIVDFHGDTSFDHLGDAVSGAGDVNADGVPDIVAGAYRYDENGAEGLVRVFSGADGSVLHTFFGLSGDASYGRDVAAAGDIDGDGYDDVIVGLRYQDPQQPNSGSARVFSGRDGSVLLTLYAAPDGNTLRSAVTGARDMNGDGVPDLLLGDAMDDGVGNRSGAVYLFSGVDGSVIWDVRGGAFGDQLGYSVDVLGDVNGDDVPDVVVGADHGFSDGMGEALVLSGVDGSVLLTLQADEADSFFGRAVSAAGDVDADGVQDVIVGAPGSDHVATLAGMARVYSGADGSVLHTFYGASNGDRLGRAVSDAGDVDGDGHADLLVAVQDDGPYVGTGSVHVYSGRTGERLAWILSWTPNDAFGTDVASVGDLTGDGVPEVVIGAYLGDVNGTASGTTSIFSPVSPFIYYCSPLPNTTGSRAILTAVGSSSVQSNDIEMHVTGLPTTSGLFIYGDQSTNVPLGEGRLCVAGNAARIVPGVFASNGQIDYELDLTDAPLDTLFVAGTTWHFQLWYRDFQSNAGFNLSGAMRVAFTP